MYRTTLTRPLAGLYARQFSSSQPTRKTMTEKMSEVAEKVNKSVGRGLASALETGEQATEKTKVGVKRGTGSMAEQIGNKKHKVGDRIKRALEETNDTKDTTRK